jgi:hypothetical protein
VRSQDFQDNERPIDRRAISLREVERLTHDMGYPPNFAISPTLRAGLWFTALLCEGSERRDGPSAETDTFILPLSSYRVIPVGWL